MYTCSGRSASVFAMLVELRAGQPQVIGKRILVVDVQVDHAHGVAIGIGIDEHSVDDAIDGGLGTYADGQGGNDGNGEKRRPGGLPPGEAEIGEGVLQPLPLPDFAAGLLDEGHIAELAACGQFGFAAAHALVHQLLGGFLEMFLYGDGEIVVAAAAGEGLPDRIHAAALR